MKIIYRDLLGRRKRVECSSQRELFARAWSLYRLTRGLNLVADFGEAVVREIKAFA